MRSWKHDQSSIIDTIYTTELLRKLESPFFILARYFPICATVRHALVLMNSNDELYAMPYGLNFLKYLKIESNLSWVIS